MKKQTKYICEGCGVDYDREEDAKKCEASHIKPVKVLKANYEYIGGKNLPVSVTVKFENGAEREYVAKGRG